MGSYDFYYCSVYCNEIKLISIFVNYCQRAGQSENIIYITSIMASSDHNNVEHKMLANIINQIVKDTAH